ncbi:MAG: MaoC family dehydratase [Desulfarculaceae bacterium]|nr:MaoC family dehydratase [Desulfarculaceae bacterium]MCF8073480.1 MaoC family dehydratase [Desulfarculaceae bacterium]MCF8100373.1 MaoC family dehydratase [Desulfarculaceae bacterium]MCF8115891.1 MaoC family dehydratase [Desulfarculaceae bacterium]
MYWQQFEPGLRRVSPEREITGEHIDGFVSSTGLELAMFTSDEGARAAGHDTRVVPGLMVLSVAMGLVQMTGMFDHVVAVMGFEGLRFLRWTFLGDRVKVSAEVLSVAPDNQERGKAVLEFSVTNQQDQVVAQARANYLIQMQPA